MGNDDSKKNNTLVELIDIIKTLRSENGCSWDREQTHESLKKNMLEEAYEAIDAINHNDKDNLKEELGDVFLQVLLHSQIASENGDFDIYEVAKVLKDKLIRRHPHVFGNVSVNTTEDIIQNWEKIKQEEKKDQRSSIMDGISKSQSALMTALKISKKAVSVGFEWQSEQELIDCIKSEFQEFKNAYSRENLEEELGDILFAVTNLARWHKLDPEQALIKANNKFINRFKKMEELSKGRSLEQCSIIELQSLWDYSKKYF